MAAPAGDRVAEPVGDSGHGPRGRPCALRGRDARMRPSRRRLLRPGELVPEFVGLLDGECRGEQRPRVRLLEGDVRAGGGDEPGHDRLEPLVVRVELLELVEHPFALGFLLERLFGDAGAVGAERAHQRPEVPLLHTAGPASSRTSIAFTSSWSLCKTSKTFGIDPPSVCQVWAFACALAATLAPRPQTQIFRRLAA